MLNKLPRDDITVRVKTMGDDLDVCDDGGAHTPDWATAFIESDGGADYIDVMCSKCGRDGCVGKASFIEAGISW